MSIEIKNFSQEMGEDGMGYRVRKRRISSLGINPKRGFDDGPDKRRGIGVKTTFEGTALPKSEAIRIAKDSNARKGIISFLPWERATVVKDTVQH